MPRQARIKAVGIPWHVIQRANNRVACFDGDADHEYYLGLLTELAPATLCDVHAYVLMTNHVHLLLTPRETRSASELMKAVSERYAHRFNKRQRRTGSLWEGRFRSCLVQDDEYLLTCHRYIEMNPVRARMAAHPRDYRWSSYRANAEGEPSLLLRPHALLTRLAETTQARRDSYREALEVSLGEETLARIRDTINAGLPLGNESFLRRLEGELGRRVTPGKSGRPRKRADDAMEYAIW